MKDSILIIGGMGPQASLELHRRIIQLVTDQGAINGDEFPEIIHASLPIADFINGKHTALAVRRINSALQRHYLWQRSACRHCL